MGATILKYISKIGYLLLCLAFVIASGGLFAADKPAADPTLAAPAWPVWVHEHWVWENEGDQASTMENAMGFVNRGIPVGAVIIDRPWSTEWNTFVPDPEKYPDLEQLIKDFHAKDIRVMMWATSIINDDAPLFQEGLDKGYYLSGGKTVKWWAGNGAFIDYTNPAAVEWWHKQMDIVLDMGIDGWKVDGSDLHSMLLLPAVGFDGRHLSWKDYRDQVYGDFFHYTREKLGNDRVISARPIDDQLLNLGIVPLLYTDRDVNFAGWVGDNDNDWAGLRHALGNMFASAAYNHVSYGSDIGGFRWDNQEAFKDVFIRWTQLGAFCPVMENGGGGIHQPWEYDEETTDIYRKFVLLHNELIPYIYSQAAYSYELVKPTMRPQLGTYTYLLGDDILVAPFYEEGTERSVLFPKGEWIYMFDESKVYSAGLEKLDIPLDETPAFIRKGAILPLDVSTAALGHGSALSKDYTTVAMYPVQGEKKFGLYEENKTGAMLSYVKDGGKLTVKSTATDRSLLFRIQGEGAPASVGNLPAAASMAELVTMNAGYFFENGITWIAVKDAAQGFEVQAQF